MDDIGEHILIGSFSNIMSGAIDAETQSNSVKLYHLFEMFNIRNVITKLTRVTTKTSSLIDLIVTTRQDLVCKSGTFPLGISDHHLIYALLRLKNKRPPPKIISTRDFKHMNVDSFRAEMECVPFHIADIFYEPDDSLWAWNKLFEDVADRHAPYKTIKVRSCSSP